jgi:hypothetical protein
MDNEEKRGTERGCFEDAPERIIRAVRDNCPTSRRSPGRPHKRWSYSHSGKKKKQASSLTKREVDNQLYRNDGKKFRGG